MTQQPLQSFGHELEKLAYRQERIELLLSEGIVSAEMEAQLRQTLIAVQREVESLRAAPTIHRLAA